MIYEMELSTRSEIEAYNMPTKNSERATILAMEVPEWKPSQSFEQRMERSDIIRNQAFARQEQQVIDKRFHLEMLAGKITAYKKGVEDGALEIRQFAKTHGLDEMLDFRPWDEHDIHSVINSDPIGAALKWMHSDHSC